MKNMVTLYIAIHNKTGMKYFGKTQKYFNQKDLQDKYHGSGIYWLRHLQKHGDDVTMKIYGIFNKLKVKDIAIKFSNENNIVESDEWANLMPETGIDGGPLYGKMNGMYGKTHSEKTREKLSKQLKNKVIVVDKNGKIFQTTVDDERYKSGELVAHSKGRKISNEALLRNKKNGRNKLDKNPKAKIIYIYNNDDIIVYKSNGNFKYVCDMYELPYRQLLHTFYENTTAYKSGSNHIPEKYKKCIGWYAREIKE